ncbi:hypothetical protein PBY51_013608 [Eleginops maclovinus]|uniref:Uncharacterized protein n=1 Tax=Eleginops maclovinus TaxID=56733 RepID=A0AAN8AX56_ELEMC|nr:hypothetical protein PBY51_013608 [Eleginops maclovinus]
MWLTYGLLTEGLILMAGGVAPAQDEACAPGMFQRVPPPPPFSGPDPPGSASLHSPHSARPGQEHSWPDLVEPVDRRMERSPPRARFLRKHAQVWGL